MTKIWWIACIKVGLGIMCKYEALSDINFYNLVDEKTANVLYNELYTLIDSFTFTHNDDIVTGTALEIEGHAAYGKTKDGYFAAFKSGWRPKLGWQGQLFSCIKDAKKQFEEYRKRRS